MKGKRPTDTNQLAKLIADLSVGELNCPTDIARDGGWRSKLWEAEDVVRLLPYAD